MVSKHYKELVRNNQQYIASPAESEALERKLVITRLASIPQRWRHATNEFLALRSSLRDSGNLTVGEAGTYTLFVLEAYGWLCFGEAIGRGSLVDYA